MAIRIIAWTIAAIAAAAAAVFALHQFSPWPSALFYRYLMDRGGIAMHEALAKHVPPGVTSKVDEAYDPGSAATRFDVHYPAAVEASARTLPTIVWVHGGGFVSGGKEQIANYLKIIAAKGYTVIGVDYSLAPGSGYPTPIRQLNTALGYITANAQRLHVDKARLLLAGDSAGAQIAGQYAAIVSDPEYAKRVGITPSIERRQVKGVMLFCGMLDPHDLNLDGSAGGFLKSVGWSYLGAKDFMRAPDLEQFSVVRNVSAGYPSVFISVGNADGLAPHSYKFAETARKLGIPVDSLFFPKDHDPPLHHEYQFNLDTEAGQLALERAIAFLAERSR